MGRTDHKLSLRGAQRRGNPVEAEHVPTNRRCCGDEIANPRIEYGVAMTKWVRMSRLGGRMPPTGVNYPDAAIILMRVWARLPGDRSEHSGRKRRITNRNIDDVPCYTGSGRRIPRR